MAGREARGHCRVWTDTVHAAHKQQGQHSTMPVTPREPNLGTEPAILVCASKQDGPRLSKRRTRQAVLIRHKRILEQDVAVLHTAQRYLVLHLGGAARQGGCKVLQQ